MTMKKVLLIFILIPLGALNAQNVDFDDYFKDKTLRIDYTHSGNHKTHSYAIDELREEPHWGGSKTNLVDTLRYGDYFFKVRDKTSGKLIYSRGYSTLFSEWCTTDEAKETKKSFSETIIMPFPRNDAEVIFYSRDEQNRFKKEFTYTVNADSYFIKHEKNMDYPSFDVKVNGDPSDKVDIVILPEGYTREELGRFISDCREFSRSLFKYQPYNRNESQFNIRGILAPSENSGSDIPADNRWKKTILNTSFYTFDLEHYCMTTDNKSVRDLAANAPYDQIYILVNSPKYGGGAIYNHYSISVNSNRHAAKIFLHELGHGFAALGDEYYNSEVAYNDFYSPDVEPWVSNLTTLVDFENKWGSLIPDSIPVPTPNEEKYEGIPGVFEGGGYVSEDVYRPSYNCIMNDLRYHQFCKTCKKAIQKMIDFYSE